MTNGEIDLAVVHRVANDDAAWFEENPTERFRYRAYVDGETDLIWLDVPELPENMRLTLLVEVERLSEHARRRTFLWAVRVDPDAQHSFMSTTDEDDVVDLARPEQALGTADRESASTNGSANGATAAGVDTDADTDEDDIIWDFVRRRALAYLDAEDIRISQSVETGLLHAVADAFGPIVESLAFYGDPATYDEVVAGESALAADATADHGDPAYSRPMPGGRARAAVQHLFEDALADDLHQ